MKCPACAFPESRVLDSRHTDEGASIRRRRECLQCGERFTTYERLEQTPLMVVKKDQRRELFDRSKIRNGLIRACEKRPVPIEELEKLVDEVEQELRNLAQREVPSQKIGEMVMDRLREIDEVAYVRFASVYRQFKDLARFREELDRLLNREN